MSAVLQLQRLVGNSATCRLVGGPLVQRTSYQPTERESSVDSPGVAVRHPPGPLPPQTIVLADFAADSETLKPTHRALLDQLLTGESLALRARLSAVVGYTDSVGSPTRNAELRKRRAQTVLTYLNSHGLSGGTSSPAPDNAFLSANDTQPDRASNRAVVITIEPLPTVPPEPPEPPMGASPTRDVDVGNGGDLDAGVPNSPRDASLPGGLGNGHDPDAGLPPVPPTPSPVEVDVGDEYDATGWLEGFFRTGEVYMSDVNSMVANVLLAAGERRISRLDVRAHGNPTQIIIGTDVVMVSNFSTYQGTLARLGPQFTGSGFVHLESCNVGQNLALLRLFAASFSVPVYSATGFYNNILRYNTGGYVVCQPSGECRPTTRP